MRPTLQLFLLLFLSLIGLNSINAQSFIFSRYILPTDTISDEGVRFAVSSDDAEQENDEIDALYDDDIDAGWEGAPEDQNILTAGLRFRNILIPKGAKIDSAFIIVYSHEDKSATDVAQLTIYGEATDNATTFTEDMLIDARPATMAKVDWTVAEEWNIWQPYRTPDLKTIVQELLDRDGWNAGNALAFVILGKNQGPSDAENAREWESFENISDPEDGGDGQNRPERVPQLIIYYSTSSTAVDTRIMVTDTITDDAVKLAISSDDAEQENDEIDSLTDDDIDAGWEGAPEDQNILTAGLRFRNLAIPQGAVIDSAFITVWSHEDKSAADVAELTIYAEATDNAQTFTEDALIDARPATMAKVDWIVAEEWNIWQPYRTPDLKTIVQEIVNREGWEIGNAIAFVILGKNQGPSDSENAREWESFENISDPEDGGDGQNHPERVPQLKIYFSSPMATTSIPALYRTSERLKVYPNPTDQNGVQVQLDQETPAIIRLVSVNGQILQNIYTERNRWVFVNTAGLPKGIYFLHALQEGRSYVEQLVIR